MPPLLERLGVELPVVQAGMGGGLSRHELAAAVSEAGGLGTIAVGDAFHCVTFDKLMTPEPTESNAGKVPLSCMLTLMPVKVDVDALLLTCGITGVANEPVASALFS